MSLKRVLYSLLLYLIFPFVIIRLFWRSRANPAYRQRISERLGFVAKDSDKPIIWLHAVSVGETIAAKPLIQALIVKYPDYRMLVTSTTPTGSDRVKALFLDENSNGVSNRVAHLYFPYDLPEIVARFLKRIKPQALIVVETEIWPNLYAACQRKNIPITIVNARLSKQSTKAYSRIRPLVAETLARVELIAVRSKMDAESFKQLGATDKQIQIEGNIKYDFQLDPEQSKKGKLWREQWGTERKVWVAASTHAGEDEVLLAVYRSLLVSFPDLILVLVPRHPERFDKVFQLCDSFHKEGIKALRHSQLMGYHNQSFNIIVGDSMGEMQSWYAAANIVFIGGSLVATGGHNPLEATAMAVPVVSGQYMFNFEDIAPELSDAGLLFVTATIEELEIKIIELLESGLQQGFQQKAEAIMQLHSGVTARLLQGIKTNYALGARENPP